MDYLSELEVYAGAAGLIKKSIENPSDQNLKDATWDALLPLVASLRKFWLFSSALSTAFVDLLKELTSEEGAATHVSNFFSFFNYLDIEQKFSNLNKNKLSQGSLRTFFTSP